MWTLHTLDNCDVERIQHFAHRIWDLSYLNAQAVYRLSGQFIVNINPKCTVTQILPESLQKTKERFPGAVLCDKIYKTMNQNWKSKIKTAKIEAAL